MNKKINKTFFYFLIFALILSPSYLFSSRVSVKGYYRKNGTYVAPYYRSSPDKILSNNYSYKLPENKIDFSIPQINTYIPKVKKYTPQIKVNIPKPKKITIPVYTPLKETKTNMAYRSLQSILASLDYDVGVIDGQFGKKTKSCIRQFQINNGLKPDGIVGYMTSKILIEEYSRCYESSISVIDGDTFWWKGEKIRLAGFNAPELNESDGYIAKLRLFDVLNSGVVTIEPVARDKYGRTVAKVKINGEDIKNILE